MKDGKKLKIGESGRSNGFADDKRHEKQSPRDGPYTQFLTDKEDHLCTGRLETDEEKRVSKTEEFRI